MSENSTLYKCECCGGTMEFDVKTQSLKCPNCDATIKIDSDSSTIVEHNLTIDATRRITAKEKTTSTMTCSGCGALIEIEGKETAAVCPYCGSSYVLAEKQREALIPDGVVPFKIDKNEVLVRFKKWINGKWLAPNELKKLYQYDKFQGIYVPYWTFDAQVNCPYTASGGKDRQVRYRDSDGKEKTRIETDWYPVSGNIDHFFDDIQVPATVSYKKSHFNGIEPFLFNNLKSYSPEYVSGYLAENYSVDLKEGHIDARGKMESKLVSMASNQVLRRYDRVRNVNIRPYYSNETYKYILVPVYSTSYFYKNKSYNVLINGQTGQIQGDYPKSKVKIVLIIIAVLIVVAIVYYIIKCGK